MVEIRVEKVRLDPPRINLLRSKSIEKPPAVVTPREDDERLVVTTVKLPLWMYMKLEELAHRYTTTKSTLIRIAIREILDRIEAEQHGSSL